MSSASPPKAASSSAPRFSASPPSRVPGCLRRRSASARRKRRPSRSARRTGAAHLHGRECCSRLVLYGSSSDPRSTSALASRAPRGCSTRMGMGMECPRRRRPRVARNRRGGLGRMEDYRTAQCSGRRWILAPCLAPDVLLRKRHDGLRDHHCLSTPDPCRRGEARVGHSLSVIERGVAGHRGGRERGPCPFVGP